MKGILKKLVIELMPFLLLALSLGSTVPGTLVASSGPSSSVLYLPAGAHAAGANGASWRTDVEVHNPGSSTASFTVQLLKSGADNSSPASRSYTLAAGRSRRFADVLVSEFGFEGAAALRVSVTSGTLVMTGRTYNLPGANPWNLPVGASFGQFEPGIAESDALSYGQEGRLIQLTQRPSGSLDGFRTNVGIVNTTAIPIDVHAEFYRSDGTYLGKKDGGETNLPPYGFRQLNEVLSMGGTVADGYAIVKTTTAGGGLIAFATVIDNHYSGDPIFIPAAKVSGSGTTPTLPDLVPYRPLALEGIPQDWEGPIVPDSQPGTYTTSSLSSPMTTYVKWAVANLGTADVTGTVRYELRIDGQPFQRWYSDTGLKAGYYQAVEDFKIPADTIPPGVHTLTIVADPDSEIAESNETNNSWSNSWSWTSFVFSRSSGQRPPLAFGGRSVPEARIDGAPLPVAVDARRSLALSSAEPIYVPASAHAQGQNESSWRTDLEIHNPGTAAVTYTIALLKQSTDNGGSIPTKTYSLGPQQSVRYVDVLPTVFSTDGAAALRVTSQSGALLVNSRTYNLIGTNSVGLPVGASFGQFVPGLAESEAIGPGEEGRIIQLTHRDASTLADFRSNVGFANTTASPIDLRIDLMGADGGLLATIQDDRTHLRPYESRQINGIFGEATSWLDDGYVIVRSMTPEGRFFAFATVIDNHVTGDPVFVPAVKMARSSLPPGPDEPLTLAEAAPAIAQTVASVIVGALETGSASASNAPVMSRTLYAQSAFWRPCPNGGSVSLGGPIVGFGSNQLTLTNASATFVDCGFLKKRRKWINGSLVLNGKWYPHQQFTAEPTPVRTTGDLDVSDIGSVELEGAIGPNEYGISVGGAGLQTGVPDTPPPPSPNTCPATVAPAPVSAAAGGGAFVVSVNVGSTCPWTAMSNSGFIVVTGVANGRGPGTVSFSVAANTGTARTGSLSIAGQTVMVTQTGASCSYSLSAASQPFGSSGGSGSVAVATGNGCAWTATSNDSWITVVSGSSGNGPGTVNYSVAANTTTAQRSGRMTIAGKSVTVSQAAGTTAVNLTGTWTETFSGSAQSNGTWTTTLTQSGNTISGQDLIGTGFPGLISSSITGTIVGSSVTLRDVILIQMSLAGVAVTCTETINESLTVNSNTNMSGTFSFSAACTVIGAPVPVPPVIVNDSGRITFTR